MSSRFSKSISFPVVVQRGPAGFKATVTILRSPTRATGKTYESFLAVFYRAGKRHRVRFNTYEKAFAAAEEIATELSNGPQEALVLSGEERRIYLAAVQATGRLQRAAQLLESTGLSISDVAEEAGYENLSHFHRCFREAKGETPLQFRKKWARSVL